MLYVYAIEPQVLTSWDKCRATLGLMGFQHARAIAALPSKKRWKKLVVESCREALEREEIRDREFARIREKVERASRQTVWAGSADEYDETIDPLEERWLRNAIARQDKKGEFRAIIATRNPLAHADVVIEEDVDELHPKLNVEREQRVLREGAAVASHIRTLVRNSRKLLLVDPHFDPGKYRWRSVVKACLELATANVEGQALDVEVHTLDTDSKWSAAEYKRICCENIPRLMVVGLASVRVIRWRVPEDGSEDFHERYILTDRGGYWVGKGLDEQHGVPQPLHLLSDGEWSRLFSGYSVESPLLVRLEEFVISS
jgi:hypothetical protein